MVVGIVSVKMLTAITSATERSIPAHCSALTRGRVPLNSRCRDCVCDAYDTLSVLRQERGRGTDGGRGSG